MVNYLRLMELVNTRFREEFGFLANPRDYPAALQRIIETCTDMLEEEVNDHDCECKCKDDDTTEET